MDKQYDWLFDCEDDEDKRYHDLIPTLNIEILCDVLKKDVNIINSSNLSAAEWTKFKFGLLEYEKLWEITVFKWIPNLTGDHPYIGLDIDWKTLEGKATRYFQVHMSFEDIWFGKENLVNIWEVIDF